MLENMKRELKGTCEKCVGWRGGRGGGGDGRGEEVLQLQAMHSHMKGFQPLSYTQCSVFHLLLPLQKPTEELLCNPKGPGPGV